MSFDRGLGVKEAVVWGWAQIESITEMARLLIGIFAHIMQGSIVLNLNYESKQPHLYNSNNDTECFSSYSTLASCSSFISSFQPIHTHPPHLTLFVS